MHRAVYRNLGDHESLLLSHIVDVGGLQVGVRWYEIRNPSSAPSLYKQGTYVPDANYRWISSIAMDRVGDIALGYSVSSMSVYCLIRYAGRLATDPINTLAQGETTLIAGSGSQTGHARWGDYSIMSIDPADDRTFWFTSEYYQTTAANHGKPGSALSASPHAVVPCRRRRSQALNQAARLPRPADQHPDAPRPPPSRTATSPADQYAHADADAHAHPAAPTAQPDVHRVTD